MGGAHPYRALFGRPYSKALIGWSLVGRLPVGMTPLALLLLVRSEGGSYGAAGIVVATFAIALAVGAPVAGRQVDRFGPARVLEVRVLLFCLFVAALVVLALTDAGTAAVAVAAAFAGLAMPPLSSTVRIVLPRIVPDTLRSTAYSLEASLQEVHFVGGPLLVAGLAAFDPVAALVAVGIASLVGTTMLVRLAPVRETPPSRSTGAGPLGALDSPGMRTIVLYAALAGGAFGAAELAMPAFAEREATRELGGVALACFSAGSLVGGLLAGLRPSVTHVGRFHGGALVLALGLAGFLLATSLPSLCVLAVLAGLPIAPTIGALYTLTDRLSRPGTAAEAFSWFATAVTVGLAAGNAVSGWLIDERGVRWAFGLAAVIALAGALLGWLRRSTLVGPVAADDRSVQPSTLITERP